jgi:hypothetical protein
VRHSSVVRSPARSSKTATAVPNDPAPITDARFGSCLKRRAIGAE